MALVSRTRARGLLAAYLVLKRGRRYRRAEKLVSDAEKVRPHYVVSLAPTQQEGLRGGYVRV